MIACLLEVEVEVPSVPASLQALGRIGCAVAFSITPHDSRLPVFESLPFNSLSVPGYKKLTTDITLLADYNTRGGKDRGSHASILTSPPPMSRLSLSTGLRVYLPPRTPD